MFFSLECSAPFTLMLAISKVVLSGDEISGRLHASFCANESILNIIRSIVDINFLAFMSSNF
jgi:hypothetical protein